MKRKRPGTGGIEIRIVLCVLLVLSAGGCAARPAMMVPASFEVARKIPGTVMVKEAVGGRETNPLGTSQISGRAFTEALRSSIAKAGLFDSVVEQGDADYLLTVGILSYSQVQVEFDFYVTIQTTWEFTETRELTVIWSDTFVTNYRATFDDAFMGPERLQLANEGAVRADIAEGIKRLSEARF